MDTVRTIVVFLMSVCAFAQVSVSKKSADDASMAAKAASEGMRLPVETTVNKNVSVEAVLLPPSTSKGLFGRAVADRYVPIQLIISNHSKDASMVLQSVFIDYSRWLLSGSSGDRMDPCSGDKHPAQMLIMPDCPNPIEMYEAETKGNQIASAEYRVPRGQLLDAQPWTARNLSIRILEAAGTIASGYGFAFHELGIAKGISSYNGSFMPALRYILPDATIEQLNRISDLGFRVNTVVPRESSAIVVAFFPIDRFLTPGLKKIYFNSPAVFFVPHAAVLDPKSRNVLKDALKDLGIDIKQVQQQLVDAAKEGRPNTDALILNRLSLNRVRVLVGGSMTIDQDSVAASVEGVSFDDMGDLVSFWTETGDKTGTATGRYLNGGKVVIDEAAKLGITNLSTLTDGATDTVLRFKYTLTKALTEKQKLTFRVNKADKNQKPIEGVSHDFVVPELLMAAPQIDMAEVSGATLTITGQRFYSTKDNPLKITLNASSVAGVDPVPVKTFDRKQTQITVDLAPLNLKTACWLPALTVGSMSALSSAKPFPQPPVPKITSAKKNSTRIVVTGSGFIDLKACNKALTFQIAEQKDGAIPTEATNVSINSATEAALDFPAAPAGAKWRVKVLVGGVEMANQPVE